MRLKNDNLYIYGSFRGQVDFDFGPGTSTKILQDRNADAYILCMDTAFQFKWVKTHNTTESDLSVSSMNIGHSGHIYTVFFSQYSVC
jgi:trans-aconitate methyltransferase